MYVNSSVAWPHATVIKITVYYDWGNSTALTTWVSCTVTWKETFQSALALPSRRATDLHFLHYETYSHAMLLICGGKVAECTPCRRMYFYLGMLLWVTYSGCRSVCYWTRKRRQFAIVLLYPSGFHFFFGGLITWKLMCLGHFGSKTRLCFQSELQFLPKSIF